MAGSDKIYQFFESNGILTQHPVSYVLFNENERVDKIYLLTSGEVSYFKNGVFLSKSTDLPTLIGEYSFFLGSEISNSTVVVSKSSIFFAVEHAVFDKELKKESWDTVRLLIRSMCLKLLSNNKLIESLHTRSSTGINIIKNDSEIEVERIYATNFNKLLGLSCSGNKFVELVSGSRQNNIIILDKIDCFSKYLSMNYQPDSFFIGESSVVDNKDYLIWQHIKNSKKNFKIEASSNANYIENSSQVEPIISKRLNGIKIRPTLKQQILYVSKELIQNAIYAAPRDFERGIKYNFLNRSMRPSLLNNEVPRLYIETVGHLLSVTVVDEFGSLQLTDFIERIKSNLFDSKTDYKNYESGGGGFGLYQCLRSCHILEVIVDKGKRTTIKAFFNLLQIDQGGSALSFIYQGEIR